MSRGLGAAAAGALLLVCAAGPARGAGPDLSAMDFQAYEPPKAAPAFSLPDLNGRTWTLGELRGKVVLLFFWATW